MSKPSRQVPVPAHRILKSRAADPHEMPRLIVLDVLSEALVQLAITRGQRRVSVPHTCSTPPPLSHLKVI
jgi:hypothetical protein